MNGRTDGQNDDGRGVITIAHPEPSPQVSQKKRKILEVNQVPLPFLTKNKIMSTPTTPRTTPMIPPITPVVMYLLELSLYVSVLPVKCSV